MVLAAGKRRLVRSRLVEWPTIALATIIYGGWATLTYRQAALPWWIMTPVGAWLAAWHASLQHEVLHGHPTSSRTLNRILASIPISLWMPYESYRASHLIHHRDERLTDPLDDPETFYWTEGDWRKLNPVARLIVLAQSTLFGRIVLGPAWIIPRFLAREARACLAGDPVARRAVAWHVVPAAMVVVWLVAVCKINMLYYVFGVVYPGASLMLIRSFAEHRAAAGVFERTAIVENSWVLGPLFLFNNLHAAHHEDPTMPWYEIPHWYRENRERLIRANGGLVYNTYFDVARRFLLAPHDDARHPQGRAP